jgi:hypothetical protein
MLTASGSRRSAAAAPPAAPASLRSVSRAPGSATGSSMVRGRQYAPGRRSCPGLGRAAPSHGPCLCPSALHASAKLAESRLRDLRQLAARSPRPRQAGRRDISAAQRSLRLRAPDNSRGRPARDTGCRMPCARSADLYRSGVIGAADFSGPRMAVLHKSAHPVIFSARRFRCRAGCCPAGRPG